MTVTASLWTGSPKMVETCALWRTGGDEPLEQFRTIAGRSVVVAAIAAPFVRLGMVLTTAEVAVATVVLVIAQT